MSCEYHQCLAVCVAVILGASMLLPLANAAVNCTGSSSQTMIYNVNKSVRMTWRCNATGVEAYTATINRMLNARSTDTFIGSYDFFTNKSVVASSFLYHLEDKSNGSNIKIELIIFDVKKQMNNQDGSQVNVMKDDYLYKFTLTYAPGNVSVEETKLTKLIVFEKPTITTAPRSQQINEANKNVKLRCNAIGKPQPAITWDITKGGHAYNKVGPEIVINLFTKDDVGVYKCAARNGYGKDTAEASLQYTYCGSGCSSTDIAIKMTKLNYDDGYDYEDSVNYRNVKENIETACMRLYTLKAEPNLYSCVVTKLRRGSVIANIKQTFPTGTSDPYKPLRHAIKTGRFAGFEVSFIGVVTRPIPSTPPPTVTVSIPSTIPQTVSSVNLVFGIVLGLLGFSLAVIFILIGYILRKKAPSLINKNREASNEDIENMNIVLQNINQSGSNENEGFTDEQNQSTQTASTPVYQSIEPGHSGTEYSSLSADTKITPVEPTLLSSQSQAKTHNSVSTPVDQAIPPIEPILPSSQTQANTQNSVSTLVCEAIQPGNSGLYSSLSPDTKITPSKPSLPSSENQVDTENNGSIPVYQSIQPDHSGAVYSSLSPDTKIPAIDI